MKTENTELEKFEAYLWQARDNFFIQTCDEAMLLCHESLLNVVIQPNDTLDFRRLRVLNRYSNHAPVTLATLKEKLNILIGIGNYIVDIDYANYNLSLIANTDSFSIMDELSNMLIHMMIPAHLSLLWRGYSHPSMLIVGGICFVLTGQINSRWLEWRMPLVEQMFIAGFVITAVEPCGRADTECVA